MGQVDKRLVAEAPFAQPHSAGIFFATTFAISWGSGGLFLLFRAQLEPIFGTAGPHNPIFYLAAYAPTLSALILSAAQRGGLKRLFLRLVKPFHPVWLVVALLLLPLLALILTTLPMLGLGPAPTTTRTILVVLPAILFASPQILTNTGPFGEELGWRGYALPILLESRSPFAAGILIGAIWTLWHVPAFFMTGVMGQSFASFGWWALDTIALSLVMTWLFLRANGNIVVAGMVPHFVINGMGLAGAWRARPQEAIALALVALVIVALDRRRMLKQSR